MGYICGWCTCCSIYVLINSFGDVVMYVVTFDNGKIIHIYINRHGNQNCSANGENGIWSQLKLNTSPNFKDEHSVVFQLIIM
jgi:hypothetical protein